MKLLHKMRKMALNHAECFQNDTYEAPLGRPFFSECNPILITVLQIWFKTFHLYSGNCTNWYYVGDNFCDDSNNNLQCHFDGGDCCLFNQVDLTYCTDCYCLYGKARPRYIYQRDKSISYYMYVMNTFFDSILHVLNKIFLETTC